MCYLCLLPWGNALADNAAKPVPAKVFSGTGFFVNGRGYIITNQHVVDGCKEVAIRGAAVPKTTAQVVAINEKYDLALLKTDARVQRVATLRQPRTTVLKKGEPVLVMGYPASSFATGTYQIAESKVVALKGPQDETHWIQFADAAQQGNSGGPLLDSSGNVAGVIVSKSMVTRHNQQTGQDEVISQSDIAISLPILLRFLEEHVIGYRIEGSYGYLMPKRVEEIAKAYIVNVICPQNGK